MPPLERYLRALPFALAASLWLASAAAQTGRPAAPPVRISILHLSNVTQAQPVERGVRGGLARVSTLRKQFLRDSPHTLFLFSGDTLSPSVESIRYQGRQMIEAWNAVGLDYAAFGNHEFDFGPDVLRERVAESRFRWLGANVVDKRTGGPFAGASAFEVRDFGGVKLGIFGLTSPEAALTSKPGLGVGILDPCETASNVIPQMQRLGASFIIALSHLPPEANKELARCAPQIGLVLGGQAHEQSESFVSGRPILTPEANATALSYIELFLAPDSAPALRSMHWDWIPVTHEVADDREVAAVVGRYLIDLNTVVGRTSVQLDARAAPNRTRETNVGSFIADAFRAAAGADVALFSGGSIRVDNVITPGELTLRDVLSILPFGGEVVLLEVSGETLKQALENGVSRSGPDEDKEPGRFPQISGIRFYFDTLRPPGSRVVGVTVNNRPLDPKKIYRLAVPSFLAGGGDGYGMLRGQRNIAIDKLIDNEVVRRAISRAGIIAPSADGRIRQLDAEPPE